MKKRNSIMNGKKPDYARARHWERVTHEAILSGISIGGGCRHGIEGKSILLVAEKIEGQTCPAEIREAKQGAS